MNKVIHKSGTRGEANFGWLQARYSFSFSNYYDTSRLNFGMLRVLNDDSIAPNMGFGAHPHNDMEIITIPLKGLLKHRDSMESEWQTVSPDEVQVMSAGSGLTHSEMNASSEELNLFQIWIMPNETGVEPRYNQKQFSNEERKNKLQVLVNNIAIREDGALKINQDAQISRLDLESGKSYRYNLLSDNHGVYIMVISGETNVEDETLNVRDALGIWDTDKFTIEAEEDAELLFIEVPMIL